MAAMFQELAELFENSRRAKLLKFFLFQSDIQMSAATAGSAIGIPKAAAEKEARALVRLGLLLKSRQKKNPSLSLNHSHPWLAALKNFFETTTLPDDALIRRTFRGVSGVSLIAATGILANEDRASVDLLVVARKSQAKAAGKAVFKLECAIGLPLRYAVLDAAAYAGRFEANDRLIRDVIEFRHRLILGHF